MKQILFILIFNIAFLSCKAQSPILPLKDWTDKQQHAYYKDLNNELDDFVGTWIYTNGNTSLKIILYKKEQHLNQEYSQDGSKDFYEDVIFGEYQYIENGVEKINTLSSINQDLGYSHQIWTDGIYNDNCEYMPIDDCIDGEKRLSISLRDPITGIYAEALLHKRTINGQPALKTFIVFNVGLHDQNNIPPEPTMGWRMEDIELIKQ